MREREIRIETRYDDDGPVYSTSIMCLGLVAWHGIFFVCGRCGPSPLCHPKLSFVLLWMIHGNLFGYSPFQKIKTFGTMRHICERCVSMHAYGNNRMSTGRIDVYMYVLTVHYRNIEEYPALCAHKIRKDVLLHI